MYVLIIERLIKPSFYKIGKFVKFIMIGITKSTDYCKSIKKFLYKGFYAKNLEQQQ